MPFIVGPGGDLVGPGGGHVGPGEGPPPGPPESTLTMLFDERIPESSVSLLFDIERTPPESQVGLRFDIGGKPGKTLVMPFDVAGDVASSRLRMRFDVLEGSPANEIQRILSGGVVTSYVLHFGAETTGSIAGTANAAAVLAALEALTAFAPGDLVVTGGPLNTADLVIEFQGAYAGVDVAPITITATGVVDLPPVPTTTQNGGLEPRGGTLIAGIPELWWPLMVFDKGGAYLGSLTVFKVVRPPVRYLRGMRVKNTGGMTFRISRHSHEIGLVDADRWVLLQSRKGEAPWIGTMSPRVSVDGEYEVSCVDPFAVLDDGDDVVLDQDVNDDTPATAVFTKLIALHNDIRAATDEVQWELDASGAKPYRGDIKWDGSTLACLDQVIEQSMTEVAWRGRFEAGRLVPTLMVRDRFEPGAGAAFTDGPGGNVLSGAQVVEDPQPLVFSIRLTGLTTDLAKCLPEWAQWALLDVTPEVTVSVDPGKYRNRQRQEVSVAFGLSKAVVAAQCNAIVDWLWELYHRFLMAIHDIEGRPWHEGWAYLGPPDQYEAKSNGKDSLSRRAWKTREQLVEPRPDEPAHAVMISEQSSQINLREWLIVRYNRKTGVQSVTVWAIPAATGLSLIKWELTGSTTLYYVSGGRVIERSTISTTGAFVDPYNTRIYDPAHVVAGHTVAGQYRNLRRIINGPFALAYYIDPGDGDNSFVDLGVDAAISTTSGDGSSLIAKVYPFERLRIEDWDPRRDGIGARLSRPTVFFGALTTRPRWHVVSFDVGGSARTSLVAGIGSGDMSIEVESIFGFPDPDLEPEAFPWVGAIDEGLDEEQFIVQRPSHMQGTDWVITRGANGTAAILHEPGAVVRRVSDDEWQGFPWPAERLAWPEGREWAEALLAELSVERIDVNLHITHANGDQLTIDYGSTHDIDVASEGAADRWVGTGKRVIGWSTSAAGGETEVVTAWQG